MRNFLLAVLFLGGLITGSVLLLQEVKNQNSDKPFRETPPSSAAKTKSIDKPVRINRSGGTTNTNTPGSRSNHVTRETPTYKRPHFGKDMASLSNFIKIFRKAMKKKMRASRAAAIPAGANAVITVPHVVLRSIPSPSGKQVALLYRGNEIQTTGKAISNFYPCSVFNTRGYVPVTSLEKTSGQERKKYQMTLPGQERRDRRTPWQPLSRRCTPETE